MPWEALEILGSIAMGAHWKSTMALFVNIPINDQQHELFGLFGGVFLGRIMIVVIARDLNRRVSIGAPKKLAFNCV